MKVRLFPVLCLIMVTALLAPTGVFAQEQPPAVTVSDKDAGTSVEVNADSLLVINLPSNPSTGYRWMVQSLDQKVMRQAGETEFKSQSRLLGAPATQILRFQGVAEGETAIELVYRRPWAQDEKGPKTFSLQVHSKGAYTGTWKPAEYPEVSVVNGNTPSVLPSAYNWCNNNGCTPIKDQGSCGSCWTFGTVGPLESNIKIKDGLTKDLAEQYLLSCNSDGWSCDGGWWAHDYHLNKYITGESGPGSVYEADFPYKAADNPCNPPHTHREKIASWAYVGNDSSVPTTAAIKQAIYDRGPVAAAVCVGSAFQGYTGGVFQTNECSSVNHAIVLVGWDDTSPGYWILRNSWNTTWGESGYMRIKYGTSQVGYAANYVVYNASGPTPTPVPPTPTPTTPPGGTEKIVNGGFESGTTPWVQYSSGGYQLIGTDLPHTGSYGVWAGGYNSASESIYQTIVIPSNGTLTYWWQMTSQEGTTYAYDYMYVRLYNTSGSLVATLRTRSNTASRGAWYQDTIPLSSYAGQTLRVHFSVTTDSSLLTSFYIDDVSVK